MPIKKHDFVELDFTGRLKDTNEIFDTTDAKVAKEANIFSEKGDYSPIVICIGEGHILPGIDEFLEGKEPGKFKLDLPAEKAFGKKNAKLIVMIPTSKFAEQGIQPVPGLRLNIDNRVGMIKTVTGGRCVVDFNHPLSGRDVIYELNVNKLITDKKTQVEAVLKVLLGLRSPKVSVAEKKAKVTLPELPKPLLDELSKKLKELTGLDIEYSFEK